LENNMELIGGIFTPKTVNLDIGNNLKVESVQDSYVETNYDNSNHYSIYTCDDQLIPDFNFKRDKGTVIMNWVNFPSMFSAEYSNATVGNTTEIIGGIYDGGVGSHLKTKKLVPVNITNQFKVEDEGYSVNSGFLHYINDAIQSFNKASKPYYDTFSRYSRNVYESAVDLAVLGGLVDIEAEEEYDGLSRDIENSRVNHFYSEEVKSISLPIINPRVITRDFNTLKDTFEKKTKEMLQGFKDARRTVKTPKMKKQLKELEQHFAKAVESIKNDDSLSEPQKNEGLDKLRYVYQQPEFNRIVVLEAQLKDALGDKTLEEATYEELSKYRDELKSYLKLGNGKISFMRTTEGLSGDTHEELLVSVTTYQHEIFGNGIQALERAALNFERLDIGDPNVQLPIGTRTDDSPVASRSIDEYKNRWWFVTVDAKDFGGDEELAAQANKLLEKTQGLGIGIAKGTKEMVVGTLDLVVAMAKGYSRWITMTIEEEAAFNRKAYGEINKEIDVASEFLQDQYAQYTKNSQEYVNGVKSNIEDETTRIFNDPIKTGEVVFAVGTVMVPGGSKLTKVLRRVSKGKIIKAGTKIKNGFKHHIDVPESLLKREIKFPADLNSRKMRKKFDRHRGDFGMAGENYNKKNVNLFKQKILEHMNDVDTIPLSGIFTRGDVGDVIHYYNPKTKVNVMKDMAEDFVSGWKLKETQQKSIKLTGKIGGQG